MKLKFFGGGDACYCSVQDVLSFGLLKIGIHEITILSAVGLSH